MPLSSSISRIPCIWNAVFPEVLTHIIHGRTQVTLPQRNHISCTDIQLFTLLNSQNILCIYSLFLLFLFIFTRVFFLVLVHLHLLHDYDHIAKFGFSNIFQFECNLLNYREWSHSEVCGKLPIIL